MQRFCWRGALLLSFATSVAAQETSKVTPLLSRDLADIPRLALQPGQTFYEGPNDIHCRSQRPGTIQRVLTTFCGITRHSSILGSWAEAQTHTLSATGVAWGKGNRWIRGRCQHTPSGSLRSSRDARRCLTPVDRSV
jgi:hypothetical protein